MSKLSDEKLVFNVQNGDKEAFGEIVERYEKPLRAYAYKITGNPEVVEDIVQESFIKSYRDIQSFDTKRKFSSWIYRIVHNESVSHIRRSRPSVQFDEIPEIAAEGNLAKEIEQKIDSKEDSIKLRNVVNNLDCKYREVIHLRFFEDKDYEEISEILRMPTGTVGTLLSRAKKKIREDFCKA